MKRRILISTAVLIAAAVFYLAYVVLTDPIGWLQIKLSIFPHAASDTVILNTLLPGSTEPDEVLKTYLDGTKITYKIVKVRKIWIIGIPDQMSAILIEIDKSKFIYLVHHIPGGWVMRRYTVG